jgi:hypothetical protein
MTFWILVAAIVLVHLHLEYRFWIRREKDVFAKYRDAATDPLAAANAAYLAKAAFLFLLVVMQASGLAFRAALVFSFAAYALLLLLLLPRTAYNLANLVLAAVCLAGWWIEWKS